VNSALAQADIEITLPWLPIEPNCRAGRCEVEASADMRKSLAALCAAFLVVVAGCDTPTRPSQPMPYFISGVVVEGTQPVAGASVDRGYGPGSWVTDANGVFHLPAGSSVEPQGWIAAGKGGYVQQCATQIVGTGPLTVPIVSLSVLTSAPRSSPGGFRSVSGVVQQMTGAGLQPVAGAGVDFEPSSPQSDWSAAWTVTDASGRFSLCGLPHNGVFLGASLANAYANAMVLPGQTFVEFVLH
jgi:hypothetical protein